MNSTGKTTILLSFFLFLRSFLSPCLFPIQLLPSFSSSPETSNGFNGDNCISSNSLLRNKWQKKRPFFVLIFNFFSNKIYFSQTWWVNKAKIAAMISEKCSGNLTSLDSNLSPGKMGKDLSSLSKKSNSSNFIRRTLSPVKIDTADTVSKRYLYY